MISLDLDLNEKAYTLVRYNTYHRERFILYLGELHAVFAHIRAVANYITCSGLDNAWMCAEWFDSPSLLRQVIECLYMKRAIDALEPTIIAISIVLLKEMMIDFKDEIGTTGDSFLKFIDQLRTAIFDGGRCKGGTSTFSLTWKKFCIQLQSLTFDSKLLRVISKRKGNKVFQFLMGFMRIIGRLFRSFKDTKLASTLVYSRRANEGLC